MIDFEKLPEDLQHHLKDTGIASEKVFQDMRRLQELDSIKCKLCDEISRLVAIENGIKQTKKGAKA